VLVHLSNRRFLSHSFRKVRLRRVVGLPFFDLLLSGTLLPSKTFMMSSPVDPLSEDPHNFFIRDFHPRNPSQSVPFFHCPTLRSRLIAPTPIPPPPLPALLSTRCPRYQISVEGLPNLPSVIFPGRFSPTEGFPS